jgi:hypothetical protein
MKGRLVAAVDIAARYVTDQPSAQGKYTGAIGGVAAAMQHSFSDLMPPRLAASSCRLGIYCRP